MDIMTNNLWRQRWSVLPG